MLKKKAKNFLDEVETLIGRNAFFEGTIKTDKVIRIDGKISGNIYAGGVIIGETAEITGDIESNVILAGGTIKGNINAVEAIEVLQSAKIFGDIKTTSLAIAEGAQFYGKSSMTIKEAINGAETK
ncbi:MAG: polymer-forming cytoskeletal protein [Endomicrobium sp.]|nr:polymer-forming cytoskeletal protein [Endomicrobium sp.]MDR2399572.1 polymer-forming cytoskeletal protein [Endomicrobium sp.]